MTIPWRVLVVASLSLLLYPSPASPGNVPDSDVARPQDLETIQFKIVLLEKFTRFVEWPRDSDVKDTSKPFVIGVIEDEAFRKNLDDAYANQLIKNKKVVVRLIVHQSEIAGCNLIFIPNILKWEFSSIIEAIKKKPIFTISEVNDVPPKGIHIGLFMRREKIRYWVNETALKESNFECDWHLLKGAEELLEPLRRRR